MNGTQLIWVVLLTFTFIVAILTTPIFLITNSQNETTNNSGNNTDSSPEEFAGYCMNLVTAITLKSNKQSRVNVQIYTEEKGVKNFYGIPENARGKCLHQMFN